MKASRLFKVHACELRIVVNYIQEIVITFRTPRIPDVSEAYSSVGIHVSLSFDMTCRSARFPGFFADGHHERGDDGARFTRALLRRSDYGRYARPN